MIIGAAEERAGEAGMLLDNVREWARGRPDVVVIGLAGSSEHGNARMDSDLDGGLSTGPVDEGTRRLGTTENSQGPGVGHA